MLVGHSGRLFRCSPLFLFLSATSRDLHQNLSWWGSGRACPPTASLGGVSGLGKCLNFIQTSAHALCQMKHQQPFLQSFFSSSYNRIPVERRRDAYTLFQSVCRLIPQFALCSLSLGIGATIARLSLDRGFALVERGHPSPSPSRSTAQRGAGDNYTSFLEMQLVANFC
jgi:hypothetical protein